MQVGNMVYDYALGKNGIVVDGPWVENGKAIDVQRAIPWEWFVLYDDGSTDGADTDDLKVINESR